jgi:acyl-CoA thioesterase-1
MTAILPIADVHSTWKLGLVTKILLLAAAAVNLLHASLAAAQQLPAVASVGVMENPCSAPPIQQDYSGLCRYRSANLVLPPATATRIIFMGDSITEGWQATRPDFFRGDRIDRGISGQTTSQMLGRFYADVIALHPAVVHILGGTNDIAGNSGPTSLDAIENNLRSMVDLARAHGIRVILGTVLPAARFGWRPDIEPVASIRALNGWIRAYARARGIAVVDYYTLLDDGRHGLAPIDSGDGVHPSAAGYAKMEVALTAKLQRMTSPRRRPR